MLDIEQAAAEPSAGGWLIHWRIRNAGSAALAIQSAWLPHSRFRSSERTLDPPLVVPAGDQAMVDSVVVWDGQAVENAFLILRTNAGRLFARLRVGAGPSPASSVEAITGD